MLTKIQKRDGRTVPFNIEKIADAIYKAARAVGGNDYQEATEMAEKVCAYLETNETTSGKLPTVEEVQDAVEKVLVESGHAKTAKAYILYRADRTRVREMNTSLMKIYEDLTFKAARDCDIKRENANIDGDTAMGTMLKYGSEGAKQFNEMYVLAPEHSKAHREGDIHIHDLDFLTLTTTCCQIDLIKLFKNGFSTGHGFLREPNDISSYSALACIAIQSNQNDQHGGQSIPNFDYAMAEGVKKTYKRRYTQNIVRGLELIGGIEDLETAEGKVKEYTKQLQDEKQLVPTLANNNGYQEAERECLKAISPDITDEIIDKIQKFALKQAETETDRATYQAMEALVHNLNTMNSRAGAQIPFSSIN